MKRSIVLIILSLVFAGCTTIENWSDREKQTAAIVAGIVIGAVIIAESDGDTVINELKEECRALPHGSCN